MKVLIVYYSMHGHVLRMARAVEEGVKTVDGVEIELWPLRKIGDDILNKIHLPED